MQRTLFIQTLLNQSRSPSYLEIGIYGGRNFLKIRAARKFAVDPVLGLSFRKKLFALLRNPTNFYNRYYETTSEEFFARHSEDLPEMGLDVVFIDGLHTYSQALRDTEHSLARLKPDGVIVLHDCNPPHEAAAIPASSLQEARDLELPGWDNRWCGDVWKVIVHLRSQRRDLNAHVIDCDTGLGVVRKGLNQKPLSFEMRALAACDYADLQRHRAEWLDLRSAEALKR